MTDDRTQRVDAPPAPETRAPTPFAALVAGGAISLAAVGSLIGALTTYEGKRNVGYRDIAGIPTACMGDTANVVVGRYYSDAECRTRLERQAAAHLGEVLRCTPRLKGRDQQLIAAGSLAYNIGGAAYCRSTVDRRFDAGDWRGGCDGLAAWSKARVKGRLVVVRGLVNRRAMERAICMKGL